MEKTLDPEPGQQLDGCAHVSYPSTMRSISHTRTGAILITNRTKICICSRQILTLTTRRSIIECTPNYTCATPTVMSKV
jgi:hypothetical protein